MPCKCKAGVENRSYKRGELLCNYGAGSVLEPAHDDGLGHRSMGGRDYGEGGEEELGLPRCLRESQ